MKPRGEPGNDDQIDEIDPATGERVRTLSRTAAHAEGAWHAVFHCLIVRPTTATVVLQQRSPTKKAFPGSLDLSATGHLDAGEAPIDGRRELAEELGVEVEASALVPLGSRLLADQSGEGTNREMVWVYFLAEDRPLSEYRPDEREVTALVEVGVTDLLDCLSGAESSAHGLRWEPGATQSQPCTVGVADLVPAVDGYWTVLLVMAQRYLAGQRPIAI